jgi:hypothetical protein
MSADAQEQAALSFLSTIASRSHHATLCARAIAQQYDRFRGAVEVRSHCEALERAALRRAREQRRGLVEGALQRSRAQFEADLSALQRGRAVESVAPGSRASNEQLPAPVTFSPHPRDAGTGVRSRVIAARPLEKELGPMNCVTVYDRLTALPMRAGMYAPSLSAQRLQADEDVTDLATIPVAGSPYGARLAGALAKAEAERQRQRAREAEAARDEDEELARAIRLSEAEADGAEYVFRVGVTSEYLLDSSVAQRAMPSMPPSASAFALGLAPSGYVSSGALKGGGAPVGAKAAAKVSAAGGQAAATLIARAASLASGRPAVVVAQAAGVINAKGASAGGSASAGQSRVLGGAGVGPKRN